MPGQKLEGLKDRRACISLIIPSSILFCSFDDDWAGGSERTGGFETDTIAGSYSISGCFGP